MRKKCSHNRGYLELCQIHFCRTILVDIADTTVLNLIYAQLLYEICLWSQQIYIYISGAEDDKQCTHFDHEYIITSFTVNNKKIYLLTNQRYIVALSYKNYHPFVLKCLVVSDMKIVEIMATLV